MLFDCWKRVFASGNHFLRLNFPNFEAQLPNIMIYFPNFPDELSKISRCAFLIFRMRFPNFPAQKGKHLFLGHTPGFPNFLDYFPNFSDHFSYFLGYFLVYFRNSDILSEVWPKRDQKTIVGKSGNLGTPCLVHFWPKFGK